MGYQNKLINSGYISY